MNAFPAHRFPPRGFYSLRFFDFIDLAGLGCEGLPSQVLEFLDDHAAAACVQAADAIWNRLPTIQADLISAAEAVNACTTRSHLYGMPAWLRMDKAGPDQWAAVPAAWGTDVLADHLAPMLHHERTHPAAYKAINRLADLRGAILRGANWWPAYNRAMRALAAVPVILTIRTMPYDLAPPSYAPSDPQPPHLKAIT